MDISQKILLNLKIGNFNVNLSNTFLASCISALLFIIIAIVLGVSVKRGKPKTLAYIAEMIYELLNNFVKGILGERGKDYAPFIGALFGYIMFSNLLGLLSPLGVPGLTAPTTDLSVTASFAIIGIIYVHSISIYLRGGLKYLKHFFKPSFFMFPINLIEEIVKPISLTVRLFGNLFGEHVVYEITFALISFGIPVLIMALGIFTGLIQAYVFSMLVMVYLSELLELNEGGK
jgi:F-type H+-transporting ATPase subunit a